MLDLTAIPVVDNHCHPVLLNQHMVNTALIRKYRQVVYEMREGIIRKPSKKAGKVLYDPGLEDTLTDTLDALIQDVPGETKCMHVTGVLTSLISHLADSSQMTTAQQSLLKSIHAVLDHTE